MDAVPITKKLIAFGSKKIYLPKFTVALVRTPRLSPYQARFLVPLDFSKYDLRDYLYHAYNVKVFNIRSFVKQMPVRDTQEQPRHWFRPESKKYMTVEMEQPFVWPEIPDLEPWGKKEKLKYIQDAMNIVQHDPKKQRGTAMKLREQVERLFRKEDTAVDETIERKKKEGIDLGAEELRREEQRALREVQVKGMSRLELWEDKRTAKVVQSDDKSQFTVKA